MTTLLQTKLHIPQSRMEQIARPALNQLLDEGADHRFILVSAPAGFGKSSLVAHWLRQQIDTAKATHAPVPHVGWYELDAGDNDPQRFWSYLAATMPPAVAWAPEALAPASNLSVESHLTRLLNQLDQIPEPIYIVLDDYHVIRNGLIDEAVCFLIDHAPPALHLIMTTRSDPPLPLARWRARGQMTEIRIQDLRFSRAETARFFAATLETVLSEKELALLERQTEGWITALQLIRQSLRGRSAAATTEFVQKFHGNHRFILDYLVEEVLAQQPPAIQAFLLHTSILERLHAPLCDAVLGQQADDGTGSSQQILETLEAQNLFIFALDEVRQWFRYHHLFAEFLRVHLQATTPTQVPILHRRAAEWYAAAGLLHEAIDHALKGDAIDRAVAWAMELSPALMRRGEIATLKRLLSSFPHAAIQADYRLLLFQAWATTAVLDSQDPEPDFDQLEALLHATTLPDARRVDLLGQVLTMRTTWAANFNRVDETLRHGQQALNLLSPDAQVMRNIIALQLGNAHRIRGDLRAAMDAYDGIIEQGAAVGDALIIFITHYQQGQLLRMAEQFPAAKAIYERAIRVNQQLPASSPQVGLAHLGLAELLWEEWQADAAIAQLQHAIELCRLGGISEALAAAYHLRARIYATLGRSQEAAQALSDAEPFLHARKDADADTMVALYRLQQAVCASDGRELRTALAHLETARDMAANLRYEVALWQAIAHLHLGEPERVLQALSLVEQGDATSIRLYPIRRRVLGAAAHHRLENGDEATALLAQALTLASSAGAVAPFYEGGASVYALLESAQDSQRGPNADFADHLLAQWPGAPDMEPIGRAASPGVQATPKPAAAGLVDPLTAREAEILQLIADGLKNQEIADRLFISLNTVRYHTKNLYGKLGVHKRTQAIAKAHTLDLLA